MPFSSQNLQEVSLPVENELSGWKHLFDASIALIVELSSGGSRNCWWGGCWVQTIGRAAAAGRPEARSAGGRPWGWVREGVALDPLP